jgi:hypothetical protein
LQWIVSTNTAENHWRASLVPAAAVIPAPIAYINVVAVKKPVVGFEDRVRVLATEPSGEVSPAYNMARF